MELCQRKKKKTENVKETAEVVVRSHCQTKRKQKKHTAMLTLTPLSVCGRRTPRSTTLIPLFLFLFSFFFVCVCIYHRVQFTLGFLSLALLFPRTISPPPHTPPPLLTAFQRGRNAAVRTCHRVGRTVGGGNEIEEK